MTLDIDIEGMETLLRRFANLDNAMQKKTLLRALRRGSRELTKAVRARAPKDRGYTKKAVKVTALRANDDPRHAVVAVKFGKTVPLRNGKMVSPYYAYFVHNGTVDPRRPRKSHKADRFGNYRYDMNKGGIRGLRSNPFVADAFEAASQNTVNEFAAELKKQMQL